MKIRALLTRFAAPDEFAAREWRRLLRLRSWRSFPALFALAVLALGGGLQLLFLLLGFPGGMADPMFYCLCALLIVNLSPWVLPPLVVGIWWARSRTHQTLEDMALTSVGVWPVVRARFRMQSILILGFLAVLGLTGWIVGMTDDFSDGESLVFIPIMLAEGLVNTWANMVILAALLFLVGSMSRAFLTLLPVTAAGSGFFLLLAIDKVVSISRWEEGMFFLWASLTVLKGGVGLLVWPQLPRLLEGWITSRAEGHRGADTRVFSPIRTAGGWAQRHLKGFWSGLGVLAVTVFLIIVGGYLTDMQDLFTGWWAREARFITSAYPMLWAIPLLWAVLLLKPEERRAAWTLSLCLLLVLWFTGFCSWWLESQFQLPYEGGRWIFSLVSALDGPLSAALLLLAWGWTRPVSRRAFWAGLAALWFLNIPVGSTAVSLAGMGAGAAGPFSPEWTLFVGPTVVMLKGLLLAVLAVRWWARRRSA